MKTADERDASFAPEPADDLEAFVGASASLLDGNAAGLELPGDLAADTDAEDQTAARQVIEAGEHLGDDRRMPERKEIDGGAQLDPRRHGGECGEQRDALHDRAVHHDMVAAPEGVVPRGFRAAGRLEKPRGRWNALRVRTADAHADHGR